MKVLMLGRPGLFDTFGGDRVQIEQTAEELRKLGVEVDIKTGLEFDPVLYDVIHVFQLDWNPECCFQIKKAKANKKPVVFSTIHHNLEDVKRFDDTYAFDFRRISRFLFKDQFKRDLFKDFYRALIDPSRMPVVVYCSIVGLKKMYKQALSMSDVILVQTKAEMADLNRVFEVSPKWKLVQNGVSDAYLNISENLINPLGFEDYIISVGRVEPRKNQLNLIAAVKMLRSEMKKDLKLVLVGAKSKLKHFEYFMRFDQEIKENSWITHLDHIPYVKMPVYYKFAKVSVLASWFETTGLTSIEALLCNTNTVASGDQAKECLGSYASYCDPADIVSIKEAIKKEYLAPRPHVGDEFKSLYTWQTTAKKTLEVYKELLDNQK